MMARRRWLLLAMLALLLAALASLLYWTSQPPQFTTLVAAGLGRSLGLEISVGGSSEYRLRGTPVLVMRDVTVREPGAARPLLRADRILVSVPWSTIRSGGQVLAIRRIELDGPRLDLPALRHWLATRPPGQERIPTLTNGMHVNNGTIVDDRWSIDGIDVALPLLHPDKPMQARLRGRYVNPPLAMPFDLVASLSRPARQAGFSVRGDISPDHGDWSMPSSIMVSGPLNLASDSIRLTPVRVGLAAQYVDQAQRIPFVLGLHGPLLFDGATGSLSPASVVLRKGTAPPGRKTEPLLVPDLRARGVLALGTRLSLQLGGTLRQWPDGWPALPPPLGQSTSPLPFTLGYEGATDLSNTTALTLQRDATRFEGRFRVPQVLDWVDSAASGSPLPPLAGTLHTPRMDISGAQLHGVEVEFDP